MIKLQRFFMRYKKQLLLVNTILLLLAEGSKWLLRMNLPYKALMLIVGIIGVLPITLTVIKILVSFYIYLLSKKSQFYRVNFV